MTGRVTEIRREPTKQQAERKRLVDARNLWIATRGREGEGKSIYAVKR